MSEKEQIEEMEEIISQAVDEYCGLVLSNEDKHINCHKFVAEKLYSARYHKTIWHKVADGDLPKHIGDIIMAIKLDDHIITTTGRYRLYDFYISDIGRIEKDKVIAWTELPQYKE